MKTKCKKSGITQEEGQSFAKALLNGLFDETDEWMDKWADTPAKKEWLEDFLFYSEKENAKKN